MANVFPMLTVNIEAAFASIVRDKLLDCGPVLFYLDD